MRLADAAHLQPKRPPAPGHPRGHRRPTHPFAPPGLSPPCAPGGAGRAAIDAKNRLWRTKTNSAYLFSHKALATVFRAKLLQRIAQAGLALPARHPEHWVVDCKAVGAGDKALVYLGRYLYRGVLREADILSCEHGQVTFRFQNSKTRRRETRTLPGAEFLWLRHVLPKGFRRARNFGFLHPNSKRLIRLLQLLLRVDLKRVSAWTRRRSAITCPGCGAPMKILRTRILAQPPAGDRPTKGTAKACAM